MRPVRQTPASSQNVNLTDHPIPQGLSDRRVDGPLAVISSAPVRMPELVRTEIGLLLLISIEIVSAIIQLSGFARQNPFMPVFGYETAASVAVLSTILFFAGGALIVTGRKPFGSKHSEQSVIGLAVWSAMALFDFFLLPYWIPTLSVVLPGYVVFGLTGIVETAISVTAIALLTYNLQSRTGKMLLWLACGIGLGIAIAFDSQNLRLFPYYSNEIQKTIFSLNGLSPALFATAYLVLWSRIRKERAVSSLINRP